MPPSLLDVDLKGLADLIEDAGPTRLLWELVRNALDEDGVTQVDVSLIPVPGRPLVNVTVTDDAPDGFANLAHAYTLFASSYKKGDPTKAGRFNLGEKLFLAAALSTGEPVAILTTTGSVSFDPKAGRVLGRNRTETGSLITGRLRVTRDEIPAIARGLRRLLVPAGVTVQVNGEPLPVRVPLRTFQAKLPTVQAGEDGILRRVSARETTVEVYARGPDEEATLYELGVPVVETYDTFHVNIHQKVPLNLDRDNVTPAYLQAVRTLVLNATHDLIPPGDATAPWVQAGTADDRVAPEAVQTVGWRTTRPTRRRPSGPPPRASRS
jgi:hypothetical protein